MVQDADALAERVALVHERFHQPAIAEEFVDGRELYVSLIGNGDELDILPITEMVFDKRHDPAGGADRDQAAKWDEGYRARQGHPQRLRPAARPRGAGADRGDLPDRPSGRSGCATTRGSTSGSRPTARSGCSRPTPTRSSATGTTWPTRRRRRAWTTTSFIQRLVDEAMAAL